MRAKLYAAALLGLAGLTGPAAAQSSSPSSILSGVTPSSIVNKPIDTGNAIVPPRAVTIGQSKFTFSSLFSKLPVPGAQRVQGVSPLPAPSSFPSFNPFKMVGAPPRLIGDPKTAAMPIAVPVPYTPTTNVPFGVGGGN